MGQIPFRIDRGVRKGVVGHAAPCQRAEDGVDQSDRGAGSDPARELDGRRDRGVRGYPAHVENLIRPSAQQVEHDGLDGLQTAVEMAREQEVQAAAQAGHTVREVPHPAAISIRERDDTVAQRQVEALTPAGRAEDVERDATRIRRPVSAHWRRRAPGQRA